MATGRGGADGGDDGEPLERLLAQVRQSREQTIEEREDRFSGPRSEVVLSQVLARVQASQRRGSWLIRAARNLTAMGATLWNSPAIRMLVP